MAEGEEPTVKVEEIAEGSGWFKIRTDYTTHTVYQVENRSETSCVVRFAFFDVFNVRFEADEDDDAVTAEATEEGATYSALVLPGETKTVVTLRTDDGSEEWQFDYELTADEVSVPTG